MQIVFTLHAKNRLKRRKITEGEVINSIRFPDKTIKRKGKYYVQKDIGRGKIEIIYEKDKYIKVISIYWI